MSDINATEFLNGQRCYLDNKECPVNASPSFQRGYGVEYERAEIEHTSIIQRRIGSNEVNRNGDYWRAAPEGVWSLNLRRKAIT